jgi:hypothetical protein
VTKAETDAPGPESGLSGAAVGRARRARSIEAASIAGVAYSVLTILALIQFSRYPSLAVGDEELTAWFDDDAHQAWLIGALALASIGSIAFLWFVAVIRRRLGDLEDKFFATVFLGSGIVYVAVWLTGAAALAAPAVAMTQLDAGTVSAGSATLAGGLGTSLILVVAPRLQAVFIFTTSTVIMRSRVLPSPLAIVGYITGLLLFVAPLVLQPMGLLFPIWVFIVSVVLLLRRPPDLAPDEPEAGAS